MVHFCMGEALELLSGAAASASDEQSFHPAGGWRWSTGSVNAILSAVPAAGRASTQI
jgi:hypothetical protein